MKAGSQEVDVCYENMSKRVKFPDDCLENTLSHQSPVTELLSARDTTPDHWTDHDKRRRVSRRLVFMRPENGGDILNNEVFFSPPVPCQDLSTSLGFLHYCQRLLMLRSQERLRHMDKPGDRSADDLDHERSSIANEEPVTVSTLLD